MSDEVKMERAKELFATMEHSGGESDRGITHIIATHIEECLRRIFEAFLVVSKSVNELFEGSFDSLSGKTKAAFVMCLITKYEQTKIDSVRQVRNVFSHEIAAGFDHPKIEKIFRPIVEDWEMIARDSFLHMAQNAVLPLLYRDLYVVKWKRLRINQ